MNAGENRMFYRRSSAAEAFLHAFRLWGSAYEIGLARRLSKVEGGAVAWWGVSALVGTHLCLAEKERERCGGRGLIGLIAGRSPAASDLVEIYADVGTRLVGNIERPRVSIFNLCNRRAGDKSYPDILRQLSVRTDCPPAGLLHEGEPPRSFLGLTGGQYHLTRNACWPARKLVAAARCGARDLLQFEVSMGGMGWREATPASD